MKNKIILIVGIVMFILIMTSTHLLLKIKTEDDSKIQEQQGESQTVSNGENITHTGTFLVPVENYIKMTCKYGTRIHPITKKQSFHTGVDLVGNNGSYILSISNGEIFKISNTNAYGNAIEIKHIDENGNIFYSFYAHLRDNSINVKENQVVQEGQRIGIQGSTGWSTGDHLHFEIRNSNHKHIDPTSYLFEKI